MATLVKRAAASAASKPSAGGFKFQYKARTAEDVKEKARQTSGRDSYISAEAQFFTAAEGANTIRFLPPPPDADWGHYGMRVWEHRDIGVDKGAYLCLAKMKNEPCPVCEEREAASASGASDLAWSLKAQCKTLLYVINRKDEAKGPLLWNISAGGKKSMDTDLLNLCIDATDGGVLLVDHPDEGFDFSFTRTGTGLKTAYSGKSFSRRPSPLSDIPERYVAWLKHVVEHGIESKLIYHDYDYIKYALEGQAPPATREKEQTPTTAAVSTVAADPAPASAPKLQRRGAQPKEPEPVQTESDVPTDVPTWADLEEMNEDKLIGVAELYKVIDNAPRDGFDAGGADGNDPFRVWLAGQLGVEVPKPATPAATGGSWKDKLSQMQKS